jgi:hypothetical protein
MMKIFKISFLVHPARNSMLCGDEDDTLGDFLRGGPIPECVDALVEYESADGKRAKSYFDSDGINYGTRSLRPCPSTAKAIAEAKRDPARIQALRESLQRMEKNYGKNRTRQKVIPSGTRP